jgi:hypothetical protein
VRKVTAIDGLPVLNAKGPLVLTITDGDINKADNKNPADCVVARAIRRQCHAMEARVHLTRVYVRTTKDHWDRYRTPKAMRDEIIAFDRGGSFEAAAFHLPPVEPNKQVPRNSKADRRKYDKRAYVAIRPKRRPPTVVKNVRSEPVA